MKLFRRRPSAAFVVAVFALCFAIVGSAIAGTDASKKALSKSQVKKIAKKQANKAIKKAAPGLSVSHASTADTATSATSATNANSPNVYAHVTVSGTTPNVDEARSKGLADADVHSTGTPGQYCVNLPAYKTYNASVDESIGAFSGGTIATVIADPIGACNSAGFGPANAIVLVLDSTGTPVDDAFDIQLGT
jgi:hypothetical protein